MLSSSAVHHLSVQTGRVWCTAPASYCTSKTEDVNAHPSLQVENNVVGAPCGVMDQMAAVLGEEGALMAMICQPAEVEPAVVIPGHLRLWGLDSGGHGSEDLLWRLTQKEQSPSVMMLGAPPTVGPKRKRAERQEVLCWPG